MTRVLITGGAGFIGSFLAHKLVKNGRDVTIVDDLSMGRKENIEGLDVKFYQRSSVYAPVIR